MKNNTKHSASIITKKLFYYSAICSFLLMVLVFVTTISILYKRLKSAEDNNIFHTAQTRVMAADEWARRAKDLTWQITSRTRIREELEKYNRGEISSEQIASFTNPKLTDAMKLSTDILAIRRISISGMKVSECGIAIPDTKWPIPVKELTDIKLSAPFKLKNYYILILEAPILNRKNIQVGTDMVAINMQNLHTTTRNFTGLGKTSEIILGYSSQNKPHLVFPLRNSQNSISIDNSFYNTINELLEISMKGENGLKHSNNRLFAYACIKELNWGVLISQDRDELYCALNKKLIHIGILCFMIYTLFLFGFWLITKPLAGKLIYHTRELESEINEKTKDLREALENVKVLKGFLPICASCKKIRDDKGYWNKIESYIQSHSEAEFSHSICPDCAKKLYSDYNKQKEEKNK